jgi:hypothetical protein
LEMFLALFEGQTTHVGFIRIMGVFLVIIWVGETYSFHCGESLLDLIAWSYIGGTFWAFLEKIWEIHILLRSLSTFSWDHFTWRR